MESAFDRAVTVLAALSLLAVVFTTGTAQTVLAYAGGAAALVVIARLAYVARAQCHPRPPKPTGRHRKNGQPS